MTPIRKGASAWSRIMPAGLERAPSLAAPLVGHLRLGAVQASAIVRVSDGDIRAGSIGDGRDRDSLRMHPVDTWGHRGRRPPLSAGSGVVRGGTIDERFDVEGDGDEQMSLQASDYRFLDAFERVRGEREGDASVTRDERGGSRVQDLSACRQDTTTLRGCACMHLHLRAEASSGLAVAGAHVPMADIPAEEHCTRSMPRALAVGGSYVAVAHARVASWTPRALGAYSVTCC
ncbi:hypothetical protein BV25DRAFT_1922378 [Artomyces pyxidatus]|uniref:Uncharacterized protein n=1 Tax=Artomyces pyxidatus TaxID=48021 RepID=A0ACB8SEA8_9AGAM|nr:hypothetical protein BV25DRAFT_1922378 [Artomyces pyxidatus]